MANMLTSNDPQALPGIEIETDYFLCNVGPRTVFIEVAAVAPDSTDNALPVGTLHNKDVYFSRLASESVYCWSPGGISRVVYSKSLSRT